MEKRKKSAINCTLHVLCDAFALAQIKAASPQGTVGIDFPFLEGLGKKRKRRIGCRFTRRLRSGAELFGEVVFIHLLDRDGAVLANANAMADKQARELLAVDQHYAVLDVPNVVSRLLREPGRGDEHALVRSLANETAYKGLESWCTDRVAVLVALRLNIDRIQAKRVILYHAIDAAVAGTTKALAHLKIAAAETHRDQQVHHKLLKLGWVNRPGAG